MNIDFSPPGIGILACKNVTARTRYAFCCSRTVRYIYTLNTHQILYIYHFILKRRLLGAMFLVVRNTDFLGGHNVPWYIEELSQPANKRWENVTSGAVTNIVCVCASSNCTLYSWSRYLHYDSIRPWFSITTAWIELHDQNIEICCHIYCLSLQQNLEYWTAMFRVWISNYIHNYMHNVVTLPCPNYKSGLL